MPKFSKMHYNAQAELMGSAWRAIVKTKTFDAIVVDEVVRHLCVVFKRDNPLFNESLFWVAYRKEKESGS